MVRKIVRHLLGWFIAAIIMTILMAGLFRAWDIEQQEHLAEIQQSQTYAYLNAEELH